MREILYEHNTLNGFWFSLIEFLLVALFCLFLGAACLLKGNTAGHVWWGIGFGGIAVNAAIICMTVIEQMRRGNEAAVSARPIPRRAEKESDGSIPTWTVTPSRSSSPPPFPSFWRS
ncbi:MAG: hypothetical protein M3Y13_12585 [Armatimonadota bacterium]|nr:hypothetical protein [Armatimonadota bacterium]